MFDRELALTKQAIPLHRATQPKGRCPIKDTGPELSDLLMLQVGEHLLGVLARSYVAVDKFNFSVRPNQVADTLGGPVALVLAGSITQTDLSFCITQQRVGKRLLFCELCIRLHPVGAHSDDLHILCFKVLDSIPESDPFGRSAAGKSFWEPGDNDHLFPSKVLQFICLAVGARQFEIRGLDTDVQLGDRSLLARSECTRQERTQANGGKNGHDLVTPSSFKEIMLAEISHLTTPSRNRLLVPLSCDLSPEIDLMAHTGPKGTGFRLDIAGEVLC